MGEEGLGEFPPASARLGVVLSAIVEEHAPCMVGSTAYWIPVDDLELMGRARAFASHPVPSASA
jgi:hypothetical protein